MTRTAFVLVAAFLVGGCGGKGGGSSAPPAPSPTLTFLNAAFSVAETGGTATITVQRSGDGSAVSTTYSTTAGSATAGSDYTTASGTLSWAAGDFADKTFTVAIAADAVTEGSETVLLAITGSASTATLTIVDSPGTLQFTAGFGGGEGATATISVARVGGNGGAIGISYATSDGTATAADYTPASGTLSWADGDSADKSFPVTVASDALLEGDETVELTLSLPSGGASVTGTNPATLTITDTPGMLRFTAAVVNVGEGITATILVERVNGSGGVVGVTYATSSGTAGAGDYTPAGGTLSWADGDTAAKSFTVATAVDAIAEGSESVVLTLSLPTGGAVLGGTNPGTLTIGDGAGSIVFTAASFSGTEGGAASITVQRIGGMGGAVSVDVATSAGTATANIDYVESAETLSWSNGDTATKTFSVPLVDDALIESGETVTLTLSGALGGAAIGGTNPVTLTIGDGPGTVRFTAPSFSVAEGATATITVERVGGSGGPVGVSYATINGSATGADYLSSSGTLSWSAGETTTKSFTVATTQDALVEGGESVVLALSGGPISGTNPAVLDIVDDDAAGTLQFSAAAYSVSEAGSTATLTVTRTGGSAGAASVTYADAGSGTATGGDYSLAGGTLNWSAGETASKTFTVAIVNDAFSDDGETVVMTLTGAALGTPSSATLTILEPPAITTSDPGSGATFISRAKNVRLNFSKAMNPASVQAATSLAPATANPLQFHWNGANDIVTIVFDTKNPLGIEGDDLLAENTTYTLTVTAAALSATGVPMAAAYALSFTTIPDATPPSILSITPDPVAVLAGPVTQFVVTFSEAMANAFVQARVKYGIDAVWAEASVGAPSATMTVTWTNATTLTITLQGAASPLASNRAYTLQISGLSDAAGNYIEGDTDRLVVTQGGDAVAPTITAMLPADGSVNVNRDSGVLIGFSEPMAPDLASHVTVTGNGTTLFDIRQETIALFIIPRKAWPANTILQVTIDAGAVDASGNSLGATTWSFTTQAGDTSAMVPDSAYSTLVDGLTSVDQSGLGEWAVRFKNGVTGLRALLDTQDLGAEDVSITEQATGIPIKGYRLDADDDSGHLKIRPFWNGGSMPLANSTTYVVTLKPTLKNSLGVALAATTLSFTTAAAGANHRPKFDWTPESQVETSALGELLDLRTAVRNGWLPADAGDVLTVTVTSALDSPPFSVAMAPMGFGQFNYATAGVDEADFNSPGWHTLTYTADDGAGGFTSSVQDDVFVFDGAALPTLGSAGGATPTFTWTAAQAETQAIVIRVLDATGKEVYAAGVAPSATSYTLPADQALATGSYTWQILLIRFNKDDLMRIGVVSGFGLVAPGVLSVP